MWDGCNLRLSKLLLLLLGLIVYYQGGNTCRGRSAAAYFNDKFCASSENRVNKLCAVAEMLITNKVVPEGCPYPYGYGHTVHLSFAVSSAPEGPPRRC